MTHTNTEAVSDADPIDAKAFADFKAWWKETSQHKAPELKHIARKAALAGWIAALSRRSASNTGGVEVKAAALAQAYLRGVEWRDENPGHVDYAYRFKAAGDYADKATSSLAAEAEPVAWWDVQEFKVWKGIDPEKPVWHSRGFCCQTWSGANDLLEYLQHNCPDALLRVAPNRHSQSLTHPSSSVSAEVTVTDAQKPYGGFYRKCSADTPGAEWAEGVGYHVHDEQARIEGRMEAAAIAANFGRHPTLDPDADRTDAESLEQAASEADGRPEVGGE